MFTFQSSFRRLLAFTTAVSMVLPAFPLPAAAQDDAVAPPSRVGQIAAVNGSVSFNGPGTGGWAAASLNYPVSSGDSLYTQDGAQAAIALDSSKITLAADTELQITQLDQDNFAATESQGEAFFTINNLQPGQVFTITTPGGTVSISQNGQYDITAGDAGNPGVVTVFQGAASAAGAGIAAGQAEVLSSPPQQAAAQPDQFAQSLLAQTAPPPPPYAPPVVSQMTGSYELSRYGTWDQSPQYGAVWYPQVGSGWAPYREGHWVNVAPWGWTWVESEPWGFAPFHYGRWVDIDGRWGWAPAPAYQAQASYQPIYAPAVVSFFGLALAAGITAAALSSGSIGWVPLAPDEPYYPTYRCPPDYVRRINVVNVRNINIVNVHVTNNDYGGGGYRPDRFANHRAATYIPAEAMSRGESVAHYGHPAPPAMLASARPVDPGFGGHGSQPGQPPAYRLPPPGAPLAHQRPGEAPRPVAFAPPHNETRAPVHAMPGAPPNHADFNNNPAYHAPPPPPEHGEMLKPLPPAENYHPQPHPQAQQFHPQPQPQPQPQPHPQAQQFHPQEQPRPMEPQHQMEQPRPEVQQYHPEVQPRPMEPAHQMAQPRAQPQQFHPQEERPQAPQHEDHPKPEPAHNEQHP